MTANPQAHGAQGLIVHHDAWCPLAYGEGTQCAKGCRPELELVSLEDLAATMTIDFKNRAQRRAAAKAARRTNP
jgi:hypothetical protein